MAAGILQQPGSELGPCRNPCAHKDCAETRAIAAAPCRICRKPIGYDRLFYREGNPRPDSLDPPTYVHAEELEAEQDHQRQA